MDQAIARKLQYKEGDSIYYCLELPASLDAVFQGAQCRSTLPVDKNAQVDFVLLFATSSQQLQQWWRKIAPLLTPEARCWIAYPKIASGIKTDLTRDEGWMVLTEAGWEGVRLVALDSTWSAARFKPVASIPNRTRGFSKAAPVVIPGVDFEQRTVIPPTDLQALLNKHKTALSFFQALSFTNKKEYVAWITGAKKEETRSSRVLAALEKLKAGKKNPSEK